MIMQLYDWVGDISVTAGWQRMSGTWGGDAQPKSASPSFLPTVHHSSLAFVMQRGLPVT